MAGSYPIWFEAFSSEILQAWRSLQKRKEDSPLVTLWFGVLTVVFIGMILMVTNYSTEVGSEFMAVDSGAIILLVFFLFLAKALANTQRRVVKQGPLVFYLSQPHHTSDYLLGLLFGEIIFNLGLLSMVAGIAYVEIFAFQYAIMFNPIYFAQLLLAIICASILGFAFAVFNSVHPMLKRIGFIVIISTASSVFYIIMDTFPKDAISVWYMAIPLVMACVALYPAFKNFPEAWNWATSAATGIRKSVYERTTGRYAPRLMRWVGWESSLVLEKELVERVRNRDVIGSSIAVAAVSFGTMYSLGEVPDLEFVPGFVARVLPPLVIGMGLFVGTILEPGMAALGAFGKDGKAIWVLKNGPLATREVVKAKAIGALYTTPLLAVFVGLVPALYSGYSLSAGLFATIMGISMSFFCVGVGIWFGAKTPNFDQSVKGYPDVVTIYIFAMMCLVVCLLSTGLAFFFMLDSAVLGILFAILMADLGAAFLYLGIKAGAREFEKMEAP